MMIGYFRQRARAGNPTGAETRRSWYSNPPLLHMYDEQVINVLLNIGRAHLSTTFSVFSKFEATEQTSKQLCLAMASVGGLFSTVEGSGAVSKSLYNDARRLELEAALRPRQPSFQWSLNSAKTFLLLEIYGLCCGDKRSYEFVEALHYQTLEAFKSCWRTRPQNLDLGEQEQLVLLEDALGVLDSYRVLVLLLPPCFLSLSDHVAEGATVHNDQIVPNTTLKSLLMPLGRISANAMTRNLSVISAYVWTSGPHGQEGSRSQQLWRPEFVELALERWICCLPESALSGPPLSQKLLYHLAFLNLYSNLALLKRCAHEFNSPEAAGRGYKSIRALREWIGGPQFPVALWHAESMLSLIREATSQQATDSRFLEPPHTSYCIYFATLIVWYSTTVQDRPQFSRHVAIETATHLLSKLKTPVCKVLSAALSELFRRET